MLLILGRTLMLFLNSGTSSDPFLKAFGSKANAPDSQLLNNQFTVYCILYMKGESRATVSSTGSISAGAPHTEGYTAGNSYLSQGISAAISL